MGRLGSRSGNQSSCCPKSRARSARWNSNGAFGEEGSRTAARWGNVGRPPDKKSGVESHPSLWTDGELPRSPEKLPEKNFKSLRYPLWTQNKARLIQEYLRLFVYVTHHGAYIDGFAAPQESAHPDTWAAKLVLEMEPK